MLMQPVLIVADISQSFKDIAGTLVTYAPSIFALVIVVLGYFYMGTMDDAQKAMRVKEGIYRAVIGLIIVQFGISIAIATASSLK